MFEEEENAFNKGFGLNCVRRQKKKNTKTIISSVVNITCPDHLYSTQCPFDFEFHYPTPCSAIVHETTIKRKKFEITYFVLDRFGSLVFRFSRIFCKKKTNNYEYFRIVYIYT